MDSHRTEEAIMRITPAEFALTQDKIAKINARAFKKGFNGRFEIVGTLVTETKVNNFGFEVTESLIEAEITGEAPHYEGWTFLATAEWDQFAGLVTRCAPGVGSIDRDALVAGYCDHCKVTRYRKVTYVLRSEAGEQVQVGSSCIKDFLGHAVNFAFISTDEVTSEIEGGFGGGSYLDRSWTVDSILAIAWASIRAFGFVPANGYGASTKGTVLTVLNPFSKIDRKIADAVTPYIASSAEQAAKVREFILSDEFSGDSEYVRNLKAVAGAEYASAKNVGLLASAPQAYARHQERTLIREREVAQPSNWIGQVGDKIEFTGTIVSINYIDGAYGTTVLYTLRAESGNVVKWFASRESLGDQDGVQVSIKGTIKKHDEFRDQKSTVLTRCKAL